LPPTNGSESWGPKNIRIPNTEKRLNKKHQKIIPSFRKSQRETAGGEEAAAASAPRLNLLPPSRASLLGLRGLLLHADYTRELADRRLATGLRLCDADRVARGGIQNPDLYTKRVSKKIFDRWDLPRVRM
jgi:hypothetical protein